MKKVLEITFYLIFLSVVIVYFGIVFLLPQAVNSKIAINKLQSLIYSKTKIQTNIKGLKLKISPKLIFDLNIDSIDAKNNNVSVVNIKNLSLKHELLQNHLKLISADNIFIDGDYFKQFKKEKKKKNKNNFKLSNIPEIHIQKFALKSDKVSIYVENTDTNDSFINLKAKINTPFLKEPVKLGESGSLQVIENKLKANKFKVTLGNSHLYLDGILVDENKIPNFDINGEKLPVSELMPVILKLQNYRVAKSKE